MTYTVDCHKCGKILDSTKNYYGYVTKKKSIEITGEVLLCPKCKEKTMVEL